MNIALSTIVLFFVLIPGILFRRFYFSEEFSKEYFKETFFALFVSTFLPSIVFHFVWYFLVQILQFKVDLYIIADILSKQPTKSSFENIEENAVNILLYNLSLFTIACISGYYCKQIVRFKKWDRTYKFFRFQNSWHYILKGEFFDFPRADITLDEDTVEGIEFVFVNAIIEIKESTLLYDGILVDYELSGDGGLKNLSITEATRRKIGDDSTITDTGTKNDNSHTYYPIEGHILVLKYSEIKNLNFTYYTLDYNELDQTFTPRIVE